VVSLFRAEPAPLFSDLWYRVGSTRPWLSPHARVVRQEFGGHTVFVIEEAASGNFFRLSESAWFFAGLLDGRRTVDEAWQACNAQLGDAAPGQRECIEVLSHLQRFGLLGGAQPLSPTELRHREAEGRAMRRKRRLGNGLFLTIPLLNPDRALGAIAWLLRPIFSPVGLAVYVLVVLAGLGAVVREVSAFGSSLDQVLAPGNAVALGLVFLGLRAWHEFGHAAACKAFGGRCTEVGLMVLAFVLPFPYCDASSSWRFPETWKRVVVASAGMIFETFAAALAALVWASSEPGMVRTVAYNTVIAAGFTTIVFNANPLLRYDGYYILSDLTGSANLWQRSQQIWKHMVERGAFGVPGVRPPPLRSEREAWWLAAFGAASTLYRYAVAFFIIVLISERYLALGLVLAAVMAVAWFIVPLLRGAGYLAGSTRLEGRRARALALSGGALALVLTAVGLAPAPAAVHAPAVIEAAERSPVRAGEDGFIERLLVAPGERVEAGRAVVVLRNEELSAALERAEAELEGATARRAAALAGSPAEQRAAAAEFERAALEAQRLRARVGSLTLRAAVDGVVTPASGSGRDLENSVGRFARRGTLVASVVTTDRPIVRASVPDSERAFVLQAGAGAAASVRVRGDAGRRIEGRVVRVDALGQRQVRSASLAAPAGGEIVVDPTARDGRTALTPQFVVDIEPAETQGLAIGGRARVRLEGPPAPLAAQWYRRVVQYFSSRAAS
jgi:putative peptide zinc metalloprotease protein